MRRFTFILLLVMPALLATADDAVPETVIRTFAGAIVGTGDHDYFVESEIRAPLLQLAPVSLIYNYRESTPFVEKGDGPQAEVLARRQDGEVDFQLNDSLRLIAVGGYRSTYQEDQPGFLSAYEVGGGLGSAHSANGDRLAWALVGGAFVGQQGTRANWWTDARASWRVYDFHQTTNVTASVSLAGDLQMVGNSREVAPFFRVGPAVQVLTAYGNRAQAQFQWYHNDNNQFLGTDENGVLFGLDVTSALNTGVVWNAQHERPTGWLPLVWGAYDLGFSTSRQTSRMSMWVELVDFSLAQHRVTPFIWYESRQQYGTSDYENMGYSVSVGLQTPVGLASVLSHDEPLVGGIDFLHRSDHALNPNAANVPPSGYIERGSHNLLPRLVLKTTGWDLPYRDAHSYDRRTAWLSVFDWRTTLGWDVDDTRHRGKLAGQAGLNWDVATVQGFVAYATGQVSLNNETPDWTAEIGVRRPFGRVFTRYDSYGMSSTIARGNTLVFGVGVNL